MKMVRLASLDVEVSKIGFGCASLGSRVSAAKGLRALADAHALGVTWFDVAPSYGDGQAEAILGDFIRTRPGALQVCTKVGLEAGRAGLVSRLKPLVRLAIDAVPALRRVVRRRTAAVRLPLSGATVTESLHRSLGRLGLDHVDVLALHDPTAEDVARDDVLRALEDAVTLGKATAIGVAGDAALARDALAQGGIFRLAQIANNPFTPDRRRLTGIGRGGVDIITHSVLGRSGAIEQLARRLDADRLLASQAAALGCVGSSTETAVALLANYALSSNPDGLVLMSMFKHEHLRQNVAWAERAPPPGLVSLVDQIALAQEAG